MKWELGSVEHVILLYFTIFAFVEVLKEFGGLWFNFDIRAVTIESSTQFL